MLEVIAVNRGPESGTQRLGRFILGAFVFLFGAALLVIFTYAIVVELMRGTFFGMAICILVLTFGALLLRDGISLLLNLRVRLRDPD